VPRAKQRTPALRDRVLAVAVELLAEDGVAGFTTRSVASAAETSTPAVYELFGDKAGVVRAVFFEGFRMLRKRLGALEQSPDPRADVVAVIGAYRGFMRENPALAEVMFSRPFSEFQPGEAELEASGSVRVLILEKVRRCIRAGQLSGDETDIAHALVALTQGLAAAEGTRRLGTTGASVDRRWALAVNAMLDGFQSAAVSTTGLASL
jgi:AcrR family transcriptional regulator